MKWKHDNSCRLHVLLAAGLFLFLNCISSSIDYSEIADRNFREDMHRFVIGICKHTRKAHPGFLVVPQNGHDLLLDNNRSHFRNQYLAAIDGVGQEDLNFGINGMNTPTSEGTHNYMLMLLGIARENGKKVLIIDYCSKKALIDKVLTENDKLGFITFPAARRSLTNIPDYPVKPFHQNKNDITSINEAENFLYLINAEDYRTRDQFLNAIRKTDYDLVVIDLFFEEEALSREEVKSLQQKQEGGKRLILAYMSIGEAETYRYYWKKAWRTAPPPWLDRENPDWPGNYKVRYWEPSWQNLIINNSDSYLNRILQAGFDGVYLDIIDGFWYFEEAVKAKSQ